MKSYLISALAVRFGAQGQEAFLEQHSHDWLVWEAGAWKPPNKQTVSVSREALRKVEGGRAGESLAVALEPTPEGLVLGRAPQSDLVINDGTLSGHHLTFRQLEDDTWSVEDAHSKNGSRLNGVPLEPGLSVLLRDGTHIDAAHVSLTFYTSVGILRRLRNTPTP